MLAAALAALPAQALTGSAAATGTSAAGALQPALLGHIAPAEMHAHPHPASQKLLQPAENHGSPKDCYKPVLEWFSKNHENVSVLDIGGGTGDKGMLLESLYPSLQYECVDIVAQGRCGVFDGQALPLHMNSSVDFVMSIYAFHHAGANTVSLLREAARVASRRVLVLDDLKADDAHGLGMQKTHSGCQLNSNSTSGGCLFRSHDEYLQLFDQLGLTLIEQGTVNLPEIRNCCDDYTIPRGFYVLRPSTAHA